MSESRFGTLRFTHPEMDPGNTVAGLNLTPTGRIEMIDEARSIRQSILLLLSTVPGERVMRPTYGCDLHKLMFQANDDTAAGMAMHYIRQALNRWERRIDILRLDASPNAGLPGRLDILLEYRLHRSDRRDQLSFSMNLGGE